MKKEDKLTDDKNKDELEVDKAISECLDLAIKEIDGLEVRDKINEKVRIVCRLDPLKGKILKRITKANKKLI